MKKIISLITLVFMLTGFLAGCDKICDLPKDEPTNETPGDPTEENNEETPNEDPEKNNEETPKENPEENNEETPLPPIGNAVGNRFADLTLTDINGNKVNTSDFRGKIIIFNVWATWCPPCQAELPDFNEIASEYKGDVVIIAAHTYDSGMYDMPTYVENNFPDTEIIFAYDTAANTAYYAAGGVGYVPQTAIIDRNGIIIYSDSGALTRSWLASFIENNNKE